MTTPAIALPSLTLSKSETDSVGLLRARLLKVAAKNEDKSRWYEAKQDPKDLGISTPAGLPEQIAAVMGWPGTIVDATEERLDFMEWVGAYAEELGRIYRANNLSVESGRSHLDALIYGVGFVSVGAGDVAAGEPSVIVMAESTESCTVEWDYRSRRASSALSQTRDESGVVIMETLYLPDETIRFEKAAGGRLAVVSRDVHKLGRVPVARMLNRDRASDLRGRSEITRGVEYNTAAGMRTLSGLEVNREFYTSPKYTMLNVDPEVFGLDAGMSEQAKAAAKWSSTSGQMNVVPPQIDPETEERVEPKLHEFRPAPPTPYIEQVELYARLVSAESGIPIEYLGFGNGTSQSSGDSIRQHEIRLVKRVERRQASFDVGWMEVAKLALMMQGEFDPVRFAATGTRWRDAGTPTRAATADETTKLISVGVLDPRSKVTADRIGLSPQDQTILEDERRQATVGALIDKIGATPDAADGSTTAVDEANALKAKADALGVFIRAGVDPADAARRLGLDGIKFTGDVPVSLRVPEVDAAKLEG
ncbi:MAG: phage portal protein [Gordonia sp. (in: high G+C Gram-positive bacteria)]|uniref:phage portal protein n=1 Tax=Gordonia sp. (in: high G+C Gram-positive bacteria) TaxID=84139 RepID=UPI003C74AE2F